MFVLIIIFAIASTIVNRVGVDTGVRALAARTPRDMGYCADVAEQYDKQRDIISGMLAFLAIASVALTSLFFMGESYTLGGTALATVVVTGVTALRWVWIAAWVRGYDDARAASSP
ncbi:MAG: hypothetical protein Q7S66_00335 [bacterium]|nr:hypothetical protein [bacterium]